MIYRIKCFLTNIAFTVSLILTALIILFAVGCFVGHIGYSKPPKIRIAVIDSGLGGAEIQPYLCEDGNVDLTGEGIRDVNGHGSNIAAIIANHMNPETHCIMLIKWWHDKHTHVNSLFSAVDHAIESNASYINMSLEGYVPDKQEEASIKYALRHGITVVVAAGNEGSDLGTVCDVYPACYRIVHPNFYVVANFINGHRYSSTNYGGPVNAFENGVDVDAGGHVMTGTSQATAIFTNKLIRGLVKN